FAVDTVIVRLLWVVFTVMGGAGLIAYIIAAIIIPESPYGGSLSENYSRSDGYDSGQSNRNNNSRSTSLVLGTILILFGAFVLIKYLIPTIPEDMFLAAVLIGLGLFFLVRKSK
ncbi:MAG: PspC domain-containing protein, partial [Bacillota bacterium]